MQYDSWLAPTLEFTYTPVIVTSVSCSIMTLVVGSAVDVPDDCERVGGSLMVKGACTYTRFDESQRRINLERIMGSGGSEKYNSGE